MNLTEFLPTFLITLREGVEAALVVGIVLACLAKAEKSQLNFWVYLGVFTGIIASGLFAWLLTAVLPIWDHSSNPYAIVIKPMIKGGICLIAIGLLSWMLIWMSQQAKSLKSEVENAVTNALNQASLNLARWAIFTLIFMAVTQEGIEVSVFLAATLNNGFFSVIGAIAGLLVAATLGVLISQFGVKINLRQFFQIMGLILLLIVSGLVISALRNFDMAFSNLAQINEQYSYLCWATPVSCILGKLIWDATNFLPDRLFPGIILKTLFGYRDKIYLIQALSYLLFLATVGGFYWRSTFPSTKN